MTNRSRVTKVLRALEGAGERSTKEETEGTSLAVHWLRLHLPMQRVWV